MSDPDADQRGELIAVRLAQALARSPRSLAGEELALLRSRIEEQVTRGERLRTAPLENGDEPEHGFDPGRLNRDRVEDAPS